MLDMHEAHESTRLWRRGRFWNKGDKVPLRTGDSNNSNNSSGLPQGYTSQERQRSIAPDSVELLIHSGDIRCFQLAETPISAFIRDIYSPAGVNDSTNKGSGVMNNPGGRGDKGISEGMSIFPLHNSCTVGRDAARFGLFAPVKPYSNALSGVTVGAAGVKMEQMAQST